MKDKVKVFASNVISANINDVWALIKPFNGLPNWHPLIKKSRIENDENQYTIGAIRNFQTVNGDTIRETLHALDDKNYHFIYDIIESNMDVTDYYAGIRLRPITALNFTFIQWDFEFCCEDGKEKEWSDFFVSEVAQTGFDSLKEKLK